jgi:hypothetical protein
VQELEAESKEAESVSNELAEKDKKFEERLSKFELMQNTLAAEIEMMKSKNTVDTGIKLGEK